MPWDSVADYVKATEDGRVNRPKTKSYEVVKECLKDPCFVAKLHYFKSIANQLQPFLAKYQTSKPMLPFLSKISPPIIARKVHSKQLNKKL